MEARYGRNLTKNRPMPFPAVKLLVVNKNIIVKLFCVKNYEEHNIMIYISFGRKKLVLPYLVGSSNK